MTQAPSAQQADLEIAVELAKQVRGLALGWFGSVDLRAISKADGSPVTQADVAVEQRIRELLAERLPADSILGEEEGATDGTSGRRWIIDPIDGTSTFAHGVPLWSTLIALYDEHGPAIGVISLPGVDELVAAGRGLGATMNGAACHVSTTKTLGESFVTTWGYEEWPPALLEGFQNRNAKMRGWSDAYGWSLLATGRVDVVVDPTTKLWDIAPMQTIITEAGGKIHDVAGVGELEYAYSIGTNGLVHDETLQVFEPLL